jgi:hypothetical protein
VWWLDVLRPRLDLLVRHVGHIGHDFGQFDERNRRLVVGPNVEQWHERRHFVLERCDIFVERRHLLVFVVVRQRRWRQRLHSGVRNGTEMLRRCLRESRE